jgi:hypothetical protein
MNVEPEKIQAMISILQSMLTQQDNSDGLEEETPPQKSKQSGKKKISNTKNKKQSINKFDSMPEMRMHKEDISVDKKLAVHPPVPRARPFELITVQCRVCGRKEEINPVLLTDYDRYKCNRCSSSAG